MQPQSPVLNRLPFEEVIFAKDQSEYNDLPAVRFANGEVITRWKLTFIERLKLLFSGNLYLHLLTFNRPLQPIKFSFSEAEVIDSKVC